MKVILLENVRKVGSIGEVIDVKRGFARNFLISKKKALFASKENIKEVEKIKQDLNKKDQDKIGNKYNYVVLPQLDKLQYDRIQFHSNLRNNSVMVDYLLSLNRNREIDISKTLTFKKSNKSNT